MRCGKSIERAASGMRLENNFCSAQCYHGNARQVAKEKGLTRYFTTRPCKKGHSTERMVSNGRCVACLKSDKPKWGNGARTWQRKKKNTTVASRTAAYRRYSEKVKQKTGMSASYRYKRDRIRRDPSFKIIANLRTYFLSWLRRTGNHKCSNVPAMIGCDRGFLKLHLESQFQPGMTWANHGIGQGKWHIDHKRPLKLFTSGNEIEKAWHYTNLQPLWQEDNLRKRHAEVFL